MPEPHKVQLSDRTRRRARQMKPEERKQQLLREAIRMFALKGIDSATHADIAAASQVAIPTVFAYFPSREGLVNSVLDEIARFVHDDLILPAWKVKDPARRLEETASLLTSAAVSHPDYVKVWLMWGMYFGAEFQERYKRFEKKVLDDLSEFIRAGSRGDIPDPDAHDRARVIIGASGFLAKMVFDGVGEYRRKEFVENVITSVLM